MPGRFNERTKHVPIASSTSLVDAKPRKRSLGKNLHKFQPVFRLAGKTKKAHTHPYKLITIVPVSYLPRPSNIQPVNAEAIVCCSTNSDKVGRITSSGRVAVIAISTFQLRIQSIAYCHPLHEPRLRNFTSSPGHPSGVEGLAGQNHPLPRSNIQQCLLFDERPPAPSGSSKTVSSNLHLRFDPAL
ncbi:unnamed protein product [Mycena citricolor]|uniref:Uncharacterized protein n=1 Tax=Mycena citricolor TaxID=2018698 RepID=A0AAD2HLC2_9AGAR|nr:unnamed protein product [Mycena citricolor]